MAMLCELPVEAMLRLSNDSNGSWLEQASVLSMSIRLSREPCEALIDLVATEDGKWRGGE